MKTFKSALKMYHDTLQVDNGTFLYFFYSQKMLTLKPII